MATDAHPQHTPGLSQGLFWSTPQNVLEHPSSNLLQLWFFVSHLCPGGSGPFAIVVAAAPSTYGA